MTKIKEKNEEAVIVGENIKRLREMMGFNQDYVADYLGIERPNISMFERGERLPSMVNLSKLSDLFGVKVNELFESEFSVLSNAFAFKKKDSLTPDDMEKIARFRRIVKNFLRLSK